MELIKKILADAKFMVRPAENIPSPNDAVVTEAERLESLRKTLWISSLNNTFENFRKVTGTEKAFEEAYKLARGEASYSMLLIYGGCGNGKTYLCEATALELLARSIFCRVLTFPSMVRAFKNAMAPEATRPPEAILEQYCRAKYLIVDDIGSGMSGNEYALKQLDELVDFRYHECLFTLMTTNLDITELPDRTLSRFKDRVISKCVLNTGWDYRQVRQPNE